MTDRDATREEVIDWCKEQKADFVNPVYPPPSGWMWAENSGNGLVLTAIFTNTEDADIDIDIDDCRPF